MFHNRKCYYEESLKNVKVKVIPLQARGGPEGG